MASFTELYFIFFTLFMVFYSGREGLGKSGISFRGNLLIYLMSSKPNAVIYKMYLLIDKDIYVFFNFQTQRGIVVLPKSFTKSRIEENLNLFDFELTEDEMKVVESYNIDHRCVPGLKFKNCKNYPF